MYKSRASVYHLPMAYRALLAGLGALWLIGVSAPGVAIPGPYCLPVKKELRSIPVSFTATTLTGGTLQFSNGSGRPSVVSFFATWCGPCNREMPEFLRIARQYSREGLNVVLIDDRENPKAVQRFIDKFGIDFPVAIDSDGSVFQLFAFHAIPSSAFYNAKGVLTCLVQDSLEPKEIDNETSAAVGGWMPH
jgi:thiol-disulfide isomerase/thioredoxin